MLVLTRRAQQVIYLDFSEMTDDQLLALRTAGPIRLTVTETHNDKVKLGFEAPGPVKINRKEIFEKNQSEVATSKNAELIQQ